MPFQNETGTRGSFLPNSLWNPDFAAYATLCGALGIRVTKEEDLDAALERALAHEGPALVEILTDPALV